MAKPCSSAELYGNCSVHGPDGTMLFRTNADLRDWYLGMGLAKEVGPKRIDLTFVPKGPGHANDPYFLQDFQNRCVVCGSEALLSHHHVVPKCYRRHFPKDSYQYGRWMYDVLLVCIACHERYEDRALDLKRVIAKEYGVKDTETALTKDEIRMVKLSAALRRHGHLMPTARKQEMEAQFRAIAGKEPTEEALAQAWLLRKKSFTTSAAELITGQISDLDGFARRWRLHFTKAMQPRFLPEGWVPEKAIYGTSVDLGARTA